MIIMPLKDWKKRKGYWSKEKYGKLQIINILEETYPKKLFIVRILKFAKQYMRTH